MKEELDSQNARAKKELIESKQYCDKLLRSMQYDIRKVIKLEKELHLIDYGLLVGK